VNGTQTLVAFESWTRLAEGVAMIMNGSMTDERVVTSSSASSRLVAVMVRPLPVAHDVSELEAVIDLLKSPGLLFGPPDGQGLSDAVCKYTTWDLLSRPLEHLERGGISVTYIRHLLHLAAHFALRKEMRRAGSAVLSLFDEGDSLIVRYDMPVHASWQQAQRWTTEFWDDLAYVDLAKPNFLFMFVEPGEATTVSAGQ